MASLPFKLTKVLCGARTRKGSPCQRRAYGNGRCRNHGGLSTGPKTLEGRARIAALMRERWAVWRGHAVNAGQEQVGDVPKALAASPPS